MAQLYDVFFPVAFCLIVGSTVSNYSCKWRLFTNCHFMMYKLFFSYVRTVNSRQKKGLNRAVDTTFLSERDAAVDSSLSKVRQENVLIGNILAISTRL